jgi:hypothetical protein
MIGRNKSWISSSPWMDEFNKVHNPDYYYGTEKNKKKTEKKKTRGSYSKKRYPVFKVQD